MTQNYNAKIIHDHSSNLYRSLDLQGVVAIPARDEEARIGACLHAVYQSVKNLSKPIGICVLVNNSKDETYPIALRQLESYHHPFRLVSCDFEMQGGHAGRARGLALHLAAQFLSKEGYLFTTDADSTVHADWAAEALRCFAQGYDVVSGLVAYSKAEIASLPQRVREDLDREQSYWKKYVELLNLFSPEGCLQITPPLVNGANIAFRKSVFDALGLPDTASGEDRGFVTQAILNGWRVHKSNRMVVDTSCRTVGKLQTGSVASALQYRIDNADDTVHEGMENARRSVTRLRLYQYLTQRWAHPPARAHLLARFCVPLEVRNTLCANSNVVEFLLWLEHYFPACQRKTLQLSELKNELPKLRQVLSDLSKASMNYVPMTQAA